MRWLTGVALCAAAGWTQAAAWGFVAHRIVVDNAVAGLPAEMAVFYRAARERISDASIEPDTVLRDRDGEKENRRHYFDLDLLSRPPFDDVPQDEDRARALYGPARADRAGRLPWRVIGVRADLIEAFRRRDWPRVAQMSGWLAHYVADAAQPLHSTKNHDGQESCNDGIHAAFETDLIDIGKAAYRADTALPAGFRPEVVRDPRKLIFARIIESHDLVDDLLKADTESMQAVRKQRRDYYRELEARAGALARRQLARATETLASLWYTSWHEAGRPALPDSLAPPPRRGKGKGKATAERP